MVSSHYLSKAGFLVTLYEKKKIGGRISTYENEKYSFDVGAQYFTIRNKEFSEFLTEFKEKNIIKEWKSNNYSFEKENKFLKKNEENIKRYVGVPNQYSIINQIEKNLTKNISIKKKEILKVEFGEDRKWRVYSNESEEIFDFVIFAGLAPEIIRNISKDCFEQYEEKLSLVEISACECLMISFKTSLNIELDSCFINNSDKISWISKENSKPNRSSNKNDHECWVIHSTKNFKSKNPIIELYDEFIRILTIFDDKIKFEPIFKEIYSWEYAAVPKSLNEGYFFDTSKNFGICGDWCSGSRVEGAFISAYQLSDHLIKNHPINNI